MDVCAKRQPGSSGEDYGSLLTYLQQDMETTRGQLRDRAVAGCAVFRHDQVSARELTVVTVRRRQRETARKRLAHA